MIWAGVGQVLTEFPEFSLNGPKWLWHSLACLGARMVRREGEGGGFAGARYQMGQLCGESLAAAAGRAWRSLAPAHTAVAALRAAS